MIFRTDRSQSAASPSTNSLPDAADNLGRRGGRMALHLTAGVTALSALWSVSATGAGDRTEFESLYHATPAIAGNRAPAEICTVRGRDLLLVSEQAEGTVAVVDRKRRLVLRHLPTGGRAPVGICVEPDEAHAWVANSGSGSIARLTLDGSEPALVVALPGAPVGVQTDGRRVFATLSQLDQVAVLEFSSNSEGAATAPTSAGTPPQHPPRTATTGAAEPIVVRRIPVGRRPRALALTPEGAVLLAANLADGSLSVIDALKLTEVARVKLRGINPRGIGLSADGTQAYLGVMPAFNLKPTDNPLEIWHNVVQEVLINGEDSRVGENQWMDFARLQGQSQVVGTPDQNAVLVDPAGRYLWTAVGGRDVVTRITIHDPRRDAVWPIHQVEANVGANPWGLALSPDGTELWVANHLGNSLSILDARTMSSTGQLALGPASRVDPTIAGQYLFRSARLTSGHRFSCNSCHPDGASDGLSWRFVHVDDGVAVRNSRDLRAGIGSTPPFRWSGHDTALSQFIDEEVAGLFRGPRLTRSERDALEKAVRAMQTPPNPYRQAGGRLTDGARRGEQLFRGKAACASCHAGDSVGGTGKKASVGTTPSGMLLDVPHLRGVHDSAPYLHDGRAGSLEDVFLKHNPGGLHGKAEVLTPTELNDLIRYLREL